VSCSCPLHLPPFDFSALSFKICCTSFLRASVSSTHFCATRWCFWCVFLSRNTRNHPSISPIEIPDSRTSLNLWTPGHLRNDPSSIEHCWICWVSAMAAVQDPAFWKRFSVAVHQQDEEKANMSDGGSMSTVSSTPQLKHT
jgi:hypothetical protein